MPMESVIEMKHIIYFTGMPGAGKTYWGKKVAESLQLPFADLDEYIEKRKQISIAEYWAQHGEAAFRTLESECLLELIDLVEPYTVIACGGGTPAYNGNMAKMKASGFVIYLRIGFKQLMEHLEHEGHKRPLFTENKFQLHEKLEVLLKERKKYYEQANFILDFESISLPIFTEIIKKCLNLP